MKLRIAKKLLYGNSSYGRKCKSLRPPYLKDGKKIYPSWNDIDRVKQAWRVYYKHYKKYNYENRRPSIIN